MKTQILTFALLVATLSFTSCKNNEAPQAETAVTTTQAEPTTQVQDTTAKATTKTSEKEENEANEKNDKD
ncbi:MAG: hypothetical protein ABI549_11605 [Flavobacterium sp.]|uniref:hypothetical protein n=1 Tax=Flavobacterium sp. TaxID=239 RepID=UPI003265B64E